MATTPGGVGAMVAAFWTYLASRIDQQDTGHCSPCWVWRLAKTEKGYARATVPGFGKMRVHRAAYIAFRGGIPEGLVIDHLCRVPGCCNPMHLEAVTIAENNRRAEMHRARTTATHCSCGTPKKNGVCRPCKAAYQRAWNRRNPDKARANRAATKRRRRERLRAAGEAN